MKKITVGPVSASPGEKATGFLTPLQWFDGSYVKVPVAIINGTKPGPTLWIQHGSHGNEYQGMGAILRLIQTVKPEELSGALVLLPMLNVVAFNSQLRSSPLDGVDFNRAYPGAEPGKVMHILGHTEALVHAIVQEIKSTADYMIDSHDAGPLGEDTEIFFCSSPDNEITKKTRAMAFATGNPVVREVNAQNPDDRRKYPGMLGTVINEIPNITVEVGGGNTLREEYVGEAYKEYRNVMKHLGMIEGEPEHDGKSIYLNSTAMVRPRHGGILHMKCKVHDHVKTGDLLGVITDFFGEEVEQMRSPIDGVVYAFRNAAVVCTGQWCVSMGGVAPYPEM